MAPGPALGSRLSALRQGEEELCAKGEALVTALAESQTASPAARYTERYLSASPRSSSPGGGRTGVWTPHYTIHKILAGLIDQYRLAGNEQALRVALAKAAWVDARTGARCQKQMRPP